MMKKANIVKFVNTDTSDEYYYTIGKSKPIDKKTVMIAAGALVGVLGLVTAGIIVACRKHKSK